MEARSHSSGSSKRPWCRPSARPVCRCSGSGAPLASSPTKKSFPHALASRRLYSDGAEVLYDYARSEDDERFGLLTVVVNGQHVFQTSSSTTCAHRLRRQPVGRGTDRSRDRAPAPRGSGLASPMGSRCSSRVARPCRRCALAGKPANPLRRSLGTTACPSATSRKRCVPSGRSRELPELVFFLDRGLRSIPRSRAPSAPEASVSSRCSRRIQAARTSASTTTSGSHRVRGELDRPRQERRDPAQPLRGPDPDRDSRVFALNNANLTGEEMATRYTKHLNRIVQRAAAPGPYLYVVTAAGLELRWRPPTA